MKARKNPTLEQIFNRLRRPSPDSERDPRYKNDPYWVLRLQGHPHAYAKRVFRDALPVVKEFTVPTPDDGDDEDLLFEVGSVIEEVEVFLRPSLTEEIISSLPPRQSEYTVWHSSLTGFGVRVRASGHKSFILLYRGRNSRKLKKLTIGNTKSVPYKAAVDIARRLLFDAQRGCDLFRLFQRIALREEFQEKTPHLRQLPLCYPTSLDGTSEGEASPSTVEVNECGEEALRRSTIRELDSTEMKSDESPDMAVARSVVDWLCKN